MADLRLVLFGGFDATLPSGARVPLTARKAQALLAYCALRPGSHLRETLATLLWGETEDERARNSLRQTVFVLRTALAGTFSRVLRAEPDSIATDPLGLEVDVRAFERLATEDSLQALERAAALYRGDLLEGFVLDEEPFEQWVMQERERLRDLAMEVLARLFRHQCSSGAAEGAIQSARRLLALDPLQETVHRALIRLLYQTGRRKAALRQYEACVDTLKRELRLEPAPETRQLYEAVSSGGPVSPMSFPQEAAFHSAGSRPAPAATPGAGMTGHGQQQLPAALPGWVEVSARIAQIRAEREKTLRLIEQITEHRVRLQRALKENVRGLTNGEGAVVEHPHGRQTSTVE
ncbi:MAG: hypothetical protein HYY95_16865 [Candidatus Rokubacteria bacterium]|nr:hypothetical protein [Candidatus Rokubacteria bacterium]